ncbi:MAG: hypothetical protein WEF50_08440 [Myxococcota bacterium]
MLVGTADLETFARGAPRLDAFPDSPLTLPGVELLQATFELAGSGVESLFPPGLHPTLPVLAVFAFWRVDQGPLGAFTLAQLRLSCRSGARPRQLLVSSFVDGEPAREALNTCFAFGARAARVELARFYDRAEARVSLDGRTLVAVHAGAPLPLATSDLQFFASVHPAHTPKGLRLVQIDAEYALTRAERGKPVLDAFDAAGFGMPTLRPAWPVASFVAIGDVTLPRVRFVVRPDVLAFEGTERVS